MPEWKKNKKPLVASAKYLEQMSKFENSVVIADIRPEAEVKAAHIAGSTVLSTETLSTMQDKFPAKKDAPIVIVANDYNEALKSFDIIRAWGYKNSSILKGGFAAWQKAGLPTTSGDAASEIVYVAKPIPGAIGVADFEAILAKKSDDVVIIDVRTEEEVASGTIPGAINIPTEEVAERLDEIPKGKQVVTYCSTGIRAEMAYIALKDNGYTAKFLNAKTDFPEADTYTLGEN